MKELFRLRFLGALALGAFIIVVSAVRVGAETNETTLEGQRVTLLAEIASGAGPFNYQWYKNGEPIPEAVNASLVFASIRVTDSGAYAVLVSNEGGSAASLPEEIIVVSAARSRLANVSIVSPNSEAIAVDFVLGGHETEGSTPVLARAAGPALGQLGVAGALPDPVMTIANESGVLATNDDWGGTEFLIGTAAAVGAFPFLADSKDAALALTLPKSSYTVRVVDSSGMQGVTVVELYDAMTERSVLAPRILNVSARVVLRSGDAKLTAGFTIDGEQAVTVLLRGVGPGLVRLGTLLVMDDPRLTLFRGSTHVASNENWGDDGAGEIAAAATRVGAFELPENSRDSALLVRLRPGSYTVQLSSAGGAGGTGLIEVYEVP
jgi:hypothetical protein